MKQWNRIDFIKLVEENGYHYSRSNGSHSIYTNDKGNHITIPIKLKAVIAMRLIKENNLKTTDNG